MYITGIYYGKSIDSENEEKNYQTILKLIKSKDFDMQNLRQYIDLSDIKRFTSILIRIKVKEAL